VITYGGESANVTPPPSGITVQQNGNHVVINTGDTRDHNIVLSGATANGSLMVWGDRRFNLYLNGVNIRNPVGSAINIQNGSTVSAYLVGGDCVGENTGRNFLEDGAGYSTGYYDNDLNAWVQAKGTFFSEANLHIYGSGSLEIRSRNNHAIVTDDRFVMESGNVLVYESANDGIHANDSIVIRGGRVQIRSVGDGMQNERTDPVVVAGGEIKIFTTGERSHGIISETGVKIRGGTIDIVTNGAGSRGIYARGEEIVDPGNVEIHGGTLNITSNGEGARGIDSNGDVTVTNGNVTINSSGDGIRVGVDAGYFRMSGGNVFARALRSGQDIDCRGKIQHTGGTLDAMIDDRTNRVTGF
jgi:hypothetical protein